MRIAIKVRDKEHIVEFDRPPTDAEIDEVANRIYAQGSPMRGKDQGTTAKAPTRPVAKERRSQAKEDVSSLRAPYRKATVEAKPGEILRATLKNPSKPPTTAAGKQAQQAAAKRNKPLKQEQRNVGISTGKEIREGAAAMEDAMFNAVARGFVPKGTPDDKVKDAAWKERPDLSLLTSIVTGTVAMPPRILGNVVKFLEGDEPGKAAFETALDTLPLIGKGIGAGARAAERGVLGAVEKAGAQGANVGPVMGATREVVGNVLLKRQGAIKGAVRAGAAATKEVAEKGQPVAQRVQETKVQKPGGNAPLANATRRAVTPEPNVLPVNENAFWEDFYGVNSIPETPQAPARQFGGTAADTRMSVTSDAPAGGTQFLTQGPRKPSQVAQRPGSAPGEKFAGSNQASNDVRAAMGIDPVAGTPKVSTADEFTLARQGYDLDLTIADSRQVLGEVGRGGRARVLSKPEQLRMGFAKADLKARDNDLLRQINAGIDAKQDVSALQKLREEVKQATNDVTQADKYFGTEAGRTLQARNLANDADYTPAGIYQEARALAGRDVPEVRQFADDAGIKITEYDQKIADLEASLARKDAELIAAQQARQARSRPQSVAQKTAGAQKRAEERAAAAARISQIAKQAVLSNTAGSGLDFTKFAGALKDIAPDVKIIVKTLVEDGVEVLDDLVKGVRSTLNGNGIDLDDADIHRIMTNRYDGAEVRTLPEMAKRRASLVSQARKALAAESKAADDALKASIEEGKRVIREADKAARGKTVQEAARIRREARAAAQAQNAQARAELNEAMRRIRAEEAHLKKLEAERIGAAKKEGRKQASEQRKEYQQFWRQSIPGQRERIYEQIEKMEARIAADDFELPKPKPALAKELDDLLIKREAVKVQVNNRLAQLRAESEWAKMSSGEKALAEASSGLRGLKATLDLSAVLNQGMWLLRTGRWGTLGRGTRDMLKSFLSPAQFNELRGGVASHGMYERAKAAGLSLNASDLDEPSEYALSKILSKTVGSENLDLNLLAGSDRAYSAFLNRVRLDTFDSLVRGQERPWMKMFGAKELDLAELKATADYVNNITGVASTEGNIGRFANSMKAANQNLPLMFAPGYRISRWQVAFGHPLLRAQTRKNPRLAAQVLQDYVAFAASLYGTVQAAKLAGHEVDTDWQSPTFGQLKVGNTSVDITGGLLKPMQVIIAAQAGTKREGSSSASKPQPFQTLGSYAASGLHPALSTPATIGAGVQGSKLFGKSYDPKTEEGQKNLWLLFAPISVGQQFELSEDRSLTPAQKTVLRIAAIMGAGVNYREPR